MKKQIIAVDIDDVLADNAAGFVAFSNERWGTNLRPEDYDEHWAKIWSLEHDLDAIKRRRDEFMSSRIYESYAPIDQAKEVLKRLARSYELRIATSRLEVMKDGTLKWLERHYKGLFNINTVHLAGIWDNVMTDSHLATKAEVVSAIEANYLIDDQFKHCEAVAANGVKALLFGDYTWNKSSSLRESVVRVNDWAAVEEYFKHESDR